MGQNSTVRRKQSEVSRHKLKSAITNGRRLLPCEVDGRSAWMRRYRDLIDLHNVQLGGAELISEAEHRLIRRCAMLTVQAELMDAKFAQAETSASNHDLECYQRLTNTLRRTLEALGMRRRAKDVTPDLQTYLRNKAEAAE